jgi:hypothetical protein
MSGLEVRGEVRAWSTARLNNLMRYLTVKAGLLETKYDDAHLRRTFTAGARRLGLVSAVACVLVTCVYAVTLVAGLRSLPSPLEPIGDPFFSILEILILVLMPAMVVLMGAVHAWAPPQRRVFSLIAVVFVSLLAGVTCSVHFVILTVGRHAAASGAPGMPLLLSFTWPSVAYALDILAWDVFFALSVLFAAPAFQGLGLARWIRASLVLSGALALAGLSGVVAGDMRLRMIGVVGYVGVFPVAAGLMAVLFHRATPRTN